MKIKNKHICHKEHCTFGPTLAQITVTLDNDIHWAVLHLAKKYNGGCMAEFCKELIIASLKDHFFEEINEMHDLKQQQKEET